MSYICGVVFVCISTLVTQSEQGFLPQPRNYGIHKIIRFLNEAPLKTHNHEHELTQHENMMLRKSIADINRHFVKRTKIPVLPDSFDENGRIYLTRPKDDGNRKINELMNKIVKYKMEDEKMDGLRTRLNDLFNSDEIQQMENIVADTDGWGNRRLDSKENIKNRPMTVYKFSDLVL